MRLLPSVRSSGLAVGSGAQSTTVNVPVGVVAGIVAFHWWATVDNNAPTSVVFDGQLCSKIESFEATSSTGNDGVALYPFVQVTPGSKTLAWSNPNAQNQLDVSIEFRDTNLILGAHANASHAGNSTATTSAIANAAGDEILTAYTSDRPTTIVGGAGQTILDDTDDTVSFHYGFTTMQGAGSSAAQSVTGQNIGIAALAVTPVPVVQPPAIDAAQLGVRHKGRPQKWTNNTASWW